jgi:cytochrome c oxidase subunit 4
MERDDLIVDNQYSLDAHHSEEDGRRIRKKIWKITAILTIITLVEVVMGIQFNRLENKDIWMMIKTAYIVLTIAKAAFIVATFMHLGDERKTLRATILIPYAIFIIYLVIVLVMEGEAVNSIFVNQ